MRAPEKKLLAGDLELWDDEEVSLPRERSFAIPAKPSAGFGKIQEDPPESDHASHANDNAKHLSCTQHTKQYGGVYFLLEERTPRKGHTRTTPAPHPEELVPRPRHPNRKKPDQPQ
jgi:hypothetical protein